MEQNNIRFDETHQHFWEDPENHALLKETTDDGKLYYSIYSLGTTFTMLLCDDLQYAKALAERMIENGVKIFENFKELYEFNQTRFPTGAGL